MESIFASILLSLSTNIDNLAVGAAYGVKKVNIGWWANLSIALLSGLSTLAAMLVGDRLNYFLATNLSTTLGSGILIIIGFFNLMNLLVNKTKTMDLAANYQSISLKEAWLLGLILTITNWGTGIGAGMAQFNLLLTSCCSLLSSLLMIKLGSSLGNFVTIYFSSNKLELLSGVILIVLGFYEYFIPS